MTEEILIAGFGGQGVLSMGMTLAYAGMVEEKQVVWMPSYGPEMRGGTANCTVVISDEKVSSPIINSFDSVIILNQPSMDKFEESAKKGGRIIYEANNIKNLFKDFDIRYNTVQHQFNNSECGVYSINFVIRLHKRSLYLKQKQSKK